ncbi:hypothetical protein HYS99_00155 [Candidatus Giovannonibacteria bacterium]|nr:hypothetical protein [Candidatus Giovannonibacteria bacterium]
MRVKIATTILSFFVILLISIKSRAEFSCGKEQKWTASFGVHSKDVGLLGNSINDPMSREIFIVECRNYKFYAGLISQQNLSRGKNAPGSYIKYYIGINPEIKNVVVDFSYGYAMPFNSEFENAHEWVLKLSSPKTPLYYLLDYVSGERSGKIVLGQRIGISDKFALLEALQLGNGEKLDIFWDINASVSNGSRHFGTGLTNLGIRFWLPIKFGTFTLEPYYGYQITMPQFKGKKKEHVSNSNPSWAGLELRLTF